MQSSLSHKWKVVERIWMQIDIYSGGDAYLRDHVRVGQELGCLFALFFADQEIVNGGFKQFFGNSTGVLAPEAAIGFSMIGMTKCSAIVASAISLFGESYQCDRSPRRAAMEGIELAKLRELDDQYYDQREIENSGYDNANDAFLTTLSEDMVRHSYEQLVPESDRIPESGG